MLIRKIYFVVFFVLGLSYQSLNANSSPEVNFDSLNGNNLSYIFHNDEAKKKVRLFMDNVLRQFDSAQFLYMAEEEIETVENPLNKDLYTRIQKRFLETKPFLFFKTQLNALRYQQEVISEQIVQLIPKEKIINTYLEIGTPGAYINSLNSTYPFHKAIVINEAPSVIDYFHGFSWNPIQKFKSYNQFVPINDYNPISEHDIPSNSVDLVTCVIGLHHIPSEKLQPFIQSIYRILRPGGIFILREHDSKDNDTKIIVQAAHTIYNIISAELDVTAEIAEYRNFQPHGYWMDALSQAGFKNEDVTIYQDGDPTLNGLMKFMKVPSTIDDIEMSLTFNKGYSRDLTRTYLSIPEWHNVLTAEEYSKFIHHTPFYHYPYISAIQSFWDVFEKSWNQARKYQSFYEVITSEYTQMNLFVGVFMTIEYGIKALISAPIRFLFSGEEPQTIQMLIRDPNNEVMKLSSDITILQKYPFDHLKLVEVPRYMAFQTMIMSLKDFHSLEIVSFAGNRKIQFTLKYTKNSVSPFDHINGVCKLYDWEFPTIKNEKFTAVSVESSSLKDFIQYLTKNQIHIFYVHDF